LNTYLLHNRTYRCMMLVQDKTQCG